MDIDKTGDYHMHTQFSDGQASIEEMAQSAIEKRLSRICITDHMPLPCDRRYTMDRKRVDEYRLGVRTAQAEYADRLEIKLGIELEYVPQFRFWVRSILEMGWDSTIISVHSLFKNDALLMVNGSVQEFEKLLQAFDNDIRAVLKTYFETVQAAAGTGWFDIVGHLDVVKKHNTGNRYFFESDPFYKTLVRDTLDIIRQRNVKMEINTAGFNHPVNAPYPSPWVVREAMEMGIPIVLSSDAHDPGSIGQYFHAIDDCVRGKVAVFI